METDKKAIVPKKRKKWPIFLTIGIVASVLLPLVAALVSINLPSILVFSDTQQIAELKEDIQVYYNNDFCFFYDDSLIKYELHFPDGTTKRVPMRYRNSDPLIAASNNELMLQTFNNNKVTIEVTDWSFNRKRELLSFDKNDCSFRLLNNGLAVYKDNKNNVKHFINIETGENFEYDQSQDLYTNYQITEMNETYLIKQTGAQTTSLSISYDAFDSEFLSIIQKWHYKMTGFDNLFDGTFCCVFSRVARTNSIDTPNISLFIQINENGDILKYHSYGITSNERKEKAIGIRGKIAESISFE